MNIQEATKQLNELLEAWDLNEASLNQTDINAIRVVVKELYLKDREYEVLKITSESIEEDQQREIYELQQRIDKAIKHVSSLSSKGRGCEIYADVKREILNVLKDEEEE